MYTEQPKRSESLLPVYKCILTLAGLMFSGYSLPQGSSPCNRQLGVCQLVVVILNSRQKTREEALLRNRSSRHIGSNGSLFVIAVVGVFNFMFHGPAESQQVEISNQISPCRDCPLAGRDPRKLILSLVDFRNRLKPMLAPGHTVLAITSSSQAFTNTKLSNK